MPKTNEIVHLTLFQDYDAFSDALENDELYVFLKLAQPEAEKSDVSMHRQIGRGDTYVLKF